jgi:hypothetical protein
MRKYVERLFCNGRMTRFEVAHNLDTRDFVFCLRGGCDGTECVHLESGFSVQSTGLNTARVVFGMPPNSGDVYHITIIG